MRLDPMNYDHRWKFRFLRIEVWQEGRVLYHEVSRLLRKFPREELFGLTSQVRRLARSVSAKFAEGSGRFSDKDFARFVRRSFGSPSEPASDAFLAFDEGHVTEADLALLLQRIESVMAKASGLYRTLAPEATAMQRSAFRIPRDR